MSRKPAGDSFVLLKRHGLTTLVLWDFSLFKYSCVFLTFTMAWSNINPISVAKHLVYMLEKEFDCDGNAEPTYEEKLVSQLLFEKFAKVTNNYIFTDIEEHDTGGNLA